ncbi:MULTISPECIES: MDR family MFS transporter [Brevibacillus]|jgi:MFS family permease|uniref:MDR family MFS transporter n=1 Tax=Brevibacillus TaxID=55080 RepID=UPI001FA9A8AC|nr:MFS transporter [Brevibacillus borstelensis]MED1874673.1 MFS transporter [Brevibacillus borstelensis]MED2007154.1 MFS transporter [Brevibacillus borstelensis]WNF06139.1 MFS transporter [Brevibacillus borstelensis]
MYWRSWDLNLKVRLFGELITHTFFWMYFPFMALYFSDVFGKDVAGLLLMVPPLLGIVANLAGGYLADRIGRRKTMLIAIFSSSVMFALFAFSSSPWMTYVAFIGIGMAGSMYWPASSAMVADLTTEDERRVVFATFYTAMNIGVVAGPVLGSIFFVHYRFELLLACTIVEFVYGVLLFFLIRETLPSLIGKAEASPPKRFSLKEQFRSYAVIFTDKPFAIYILAGILVAIAFMQLDLYMALYVKEHVPSQPLVWWGDWSFSIGGTSAFGWLMGLNGLLVVLFTLPVTRWFQHWSDRNSLILSSVLYGFGLFLMAFTNNIWLLFGCMFVLTLGELIRTPVVQSFISKYAPEDARGQYMGASSLQFSIGRFIAPLAIGLSEWLSPLGVFSIILGISLLSALLYVYMFRLIPEGGGIERTSGYRG